MRQSSVIDINGIFVGAAVEQDHSYRFVAIHERLKVLNGVVFRSLREVKSAATTAFFSLPFVPSDKPPTRN